MCVCALQISHHPPVSAYQLDGPDNSWKLHGWSQPAVVPVVKFYGIKTVAQGARQIDFADGSSVHMTMPNFAIKGTCLFSTQQGYCYQQLQLMAMLALGAMPTMQYIHTAHSRASSIRSAAPGMILSPCTA
jgi:hypothetical protein